MRGFEEYCLPALDDPDQEIRSEAVRRLKGVIHDGERLKKILSNQLKDQSPQVIYETIIALYPHTTPDLDLRKRIYARIEAMLGGDDEARFQACRIIGEIKAAQYEKRIETMAADDLSSRVRIAAVRCLGELGFSDAVPFLLKSYAGSDRELKLTIETALLKIGKGAVEKLVSGLDSNTIEGWYLSVSVLASLDQDRAFEKMLNQGCDAKLKSFRNVNGIPEVLHREGLVDLASLYKKRIEESFSTIITTCWKVLSIYYDPIMVERLQQAIKSTHSIEKREQGLEILIELSSKFFFTAEMAGAIQSRPVLAKDNQLDLAGILKRTKIEFPDHWLDAFSDYAMKHEIGVLK
jgi:hypothetical protein